MVEISDSVLSGKKRLHFIGIGGSGMFPIAQILQTQGFQITGSDNNPSDTVELERRLGMQVTIGHAAANVEGADAVIYTAAIMKDNVELMHAKALGIPTYERSEMLGLLTKRYGNSICISGTHGKTTTCSLLTYILLQAGCDPSAVIGGKLKAIGGNGRAGGSDTIVCEACEFVDTFLKLKADTAVILNIDADHLDYFKTMENLIRSFRTFAQSASHTLVVNGDDANTLQAIDGIDKQIFFFGFSAGNRFHPEQIVSGATGYAFDLYDGDVNRGRVSLQIPGKHNILNAIAAAVCAHACGVSWQEIITHLQTFTGTGRRFEFLGRVHDVTIADDYAHHPAELKAVLTTAKEMPYHKIWAVFQPFTYSRTAMLLDDFASVLQIADHVVLSEIMGSREINTYGIHTSDLAAKIPGSVWFPTFEEIADYVMQHAEAGDLVITLGCGDIYKCAKHMLATK